MEVVTVKMNSAIAEKAPRVMRQLSRGEIRRLVGRSKVRRIAVENFLGTMGSCATTARLNAFGDARLYAWNAATLKAILDGIRMAERPKA